MQKSVQMNSIKSYLPAGISFLLACSLIAITYFINGIEEHWSMILWGCLILFQAIVIYQIVSKEKTADNCFEQLSLTKERLTNEMKHRLWAEKNASESKVKSIYIDENFPVMLAYFNTELRCRYHNRIFRRWFGLNADQIDGKLLTDFSNESFYLDIRNCIKEILTGKTIHNERTLKSTKGFPYIFTEQYVPHLDHKGKIAGFYTIHTPLAQEKSRVSLKKINPILKNRKLIALLSWLLKIMFRRHHLQRHHPPQKLPRLLQELHRQSKKENSIFFFKI